MNGKTSMSEEGKVCHVDEAMLLLYQAGRKFELVKKGFVKIWELNSNNRNGDRDTSDESDNDESLDALRPIKISMHS